MCFVFQHLNYSIHWSNKKIVLNYLLLLNIFFFLIGIHSMQCWTATTRYGVTRKINTKRLSIQEICIERTYVTYILFNPHQIQAFFVNILGSWFSSFKKIISSNIFCKLIPLSLIFTIHWEMFTVRTIMIVFLEINIHVRLLQRPINDLLVTS